MKKPTKSGKIIVKKNKEICKKQLTFKKPFDIIKKHLSKVNKKI